MTREAYGPRELLALWQAERRATRERFRQERLNLSFAERCARGLALDALEVADADAVAGGRIRLWLTTRKVADWDEVRIGNGEPVVLWRDVPDEPDAVRGVVSRRLRDKLAVVVDGELAEGLWDGGFRLDREAPEQTFDRGDRAIQRLISARPGSEEARVRGVLFEGQERAAKPLEFTPLDLHLNAPQRTAVASALASESVSLVHGPPGTGKTRTLVEIVRQAVQRGERVLVAAASNTAVDNLAERLIAARVPLVRVGHPARVSPEVEAHSLDTLVEASDPFKLAKTWTAEAEQIRRTADKRHARGALSWRERRGMLQEAGRLFKDARKLLATAQDAVLVRAKVVCVTCAGADSKLLSRFEFERVVLDEATQAPDPLALVALLRAPKITLAGDPRQLPPTILDEEAARAGLGSTFFERLASTSPALVTMLTVQHRMPEALMRFPSQSMYGGKLEAAPEAAAQTLAQLGVVEDDTRPGPLVFLDSAGRGWEEERTAEDPSTRNPGHAERLASELRRLVRRGARVSQMAVITPYEAQARLLRGLLATERAEGLEIGTVDGFQGREKELVLVDLVRSNADAELGFLRDVRRMNVALTRARRFLLVLGDSATLAGHPYYDAFLREAEASGAWISTWADDPDADLPTTPHPPESG